VHFSPTIASREIRDELGTYGVRFSPRSLAAAMTGEKPTLALPLNAQFEVQSA
jgi:hypothetical protein